EDAASCSCIPTVTRHGWFVLAHDDGARPSGVGTNAGWPRSGTQLLPAGSTLNSMPAPIRGLYATQQQSPRYNSPIPSMHKLLFRFLWCSHLLVILLCSSVGAKAADWAQPAKELAKQIAEQTSGRAVMLQVQNRSSLQQGEVDAIQDSLRRELTRVGVEQADAKQSGYLLSVTLSENVQAYVWIAEMQKDQSAPTVLIVAVARAQTSGLTMQPVSLILRKVQLWTQREQILDVAVIASSPPRLVVLDPNRITIQGLHG